jgi:4-hydroxy-2-oxoheptanedioate aldolase
MRTRALWSGVIGTAGALGLGALLAQSAQGPHLNPLVDLLATRKPVFGLNAPASPASGPARTATDLARETLARDKSDFVFSGSMEGSVDHGLPAFAAFVSALREASALITKPAPRLAHPLIVKTPRIAPDPAKAIDSISRQLNLGVSGVMFVGVESAGEVRQGLAALRFKSQGGTRPDTVGTAPAVWGLTDAEYRRKADLWPLNPNGELLNWTTVDSKEGLAHVREIAAVKGIGVLSPGTDALRGLFTTTENGQRVFDVDGWATAINQVLAACQEFHVACGYPATAADIEARMQQGFSVFLMNWTDRGFEAVEIGRRLGGR